MPIKHPINILFPSCNILSIAATMVLDTLFLLATEWQVEKDESSCCVASTHAGYMWVRGYPVKILHICSIG